MKKAVFSGAVFLALSTSCFAEQNKVLCVWDDVRIPDGSRLNAEINQAAKQGFTKVSGPGVTATDGGHGTTFSVICVTVTKS